MKIALLRLLAAALFILLFLPGALPAQAAGTAGCGAFHFSGSYSFTMQSGGLTRAYIVHVPSSYSSSVPQPLILNLHAYTSSDSGQESISGMDATSDLQDVIVAYPQGTNGSNGNAGWNIPGIVVDEPSVLAGVTWTANDVQFLSDLVSLLESQFCVDTTRIAMTGFSMGGIMSWAMACQGVPWLASIDPVASTPPSGANCAKVSYQAFHGAKDGLDLYYGNGSNPSLPAILGCGATVATYGDVYELQCAGGVLYDASNDGHTWPSSPEAFWFAVLGYGATTFNVNASNLIAQFTKGHPRG